MKYICAICGEKVDKKEGMKSHMIDKHEDIIESYFTFWQSQDLPYR